MAEVTPQTEHAVSAVVRRKDGRVLAVLRPDDPAEELPGVWGLPAVTLRPAEEPEEGLRRLGTGKLGVPLTPGRLLAEGEQHRAPSTLHMMVYQASLEGEPVLPDRSQPADVNVTRYEAFDWLEPASLKQAAERGSLCCKLFLEAEQT